MEFIIVDDFKKELRDFIKSNIKKRVPKFKNQTCYASELIAQRYLKCLEIQLVPSKNVFLDYLNVAENNCFKPDLAAKACEFYGGIFYKQFEDNLNEIYTLDDITLKLKMAYSHLTYINPIYADLFYSHTEILATYRQATDRFASGKRDEERVLRFHH